MARTRKNRDTLGNPVRKKVVWHIAVYIRLSRDDGNDESLSVTNQRKIILDFLEHSFEGEYTVVDVYVDDGMTGTDYDRPDFQRMLHDVEAGNVNCVICKNLSRAFRNYSDQGYFLESYFPLHNTRFITIGDPKVDSFMRPETIQNLEVPITGLMNDRFACKTSNDVRDTFNAKRKRGEFIGAFAPYGYAKDPKDKNSLIIDEEAAQVVREIFMWYVGGLSKRGIAQRLNDLGIPNPTAYKRRNGLQYCNPRVHVNDSLWNAITISRTLQNQMYIGNMVQGRQRVISYKVHDKVGVPEDEWFVVANTHEAIIGADVFEKAQSLNQRDTRTAPEKRELYLFSGFLRCADCKKGLNRKKARNIVYYACRTFQDKSKNHCTRHSIREDVLQAAVLKAIQQQVLFVETLAEIVDTISNATVVHTESKRLNHLLRLRTQELEKITGIVDSLYVDWKSGEISKDDYRRMRAKFEEQSEQLKQVIANLQTEIKTMAEGIQADEPYLVSFLKYRNITRLERGILVELVDSIYVYEGGEIRIEFNFADKIKRVIEFIENNRRELTVIQGGKAV